jgi:transketolase
MSSTLTPGERQELEALAFKVREHIIRLATKGGCFIGASLSCVDIVVYLYKKLLNVTPQNLQSRDRDYFFLSKGHDVPALYGLFVELGILEKERLQNHLQTNDSIYWHPNRAIPGVEFHSGSLGHLLSVSAGMAYANKLDGLKSKVCVLLGDGELNEGSIWECALVSAAHKLDNLIAIVDRNHIQANFPTEDLIPLEPLAQKFEAFGWTALTCDGNNYDALHKAFSQYPFAEGKPTIVICDTTRGKGLPSIEGRPDRWFCNFSDEEIQALLSELYTQKPTHLTSEILMVR